MKYLFTLFLCLTSVIHTHAQSLILFDTDASAFPTLQAKFYAFDAGMQQVRPSATELTLTENGIPRTITRVQCPPPASQPIALSSVLTVDVSGSMMLPSSAGTPNIELAKAAARAWITGLPAGKSECALTSFDDKSYVNQDFTTSRTKLENALVTLTPSGGTDYTMGLQQPLSGSLEISSRGQFRKVIIFLTDGLPTLSPNSAAIIAEAKQQNCPIFAVTLGMTCPQVLRDIATQTGGLWYDHVTTTQEAEDVYRMILQISQGASPCTVTWESAPTPCSAEPTSVELRLQAVHATAMYSPPAKAVASLEVRPPFVTFGAQRVAQQVDKVLTLTAYAADMRILGITRTHGSPDMSVVSPTFPIVIPKNTSASVTLRFTPADSGMKYAGFEILTDRCGASFGASGGFRTIPTTSPTLRLTHPNGGEVFMVGSDTVITWSGIAPSDTVMLQYSVDAGTTWKTLNTAAAGLQEIWKNIPQPASNQCLVRVQQSPFGRSNLTPGSMQFNLTGHASTVTHVQWSADGTKVVTTSSDHTARIWSATTGEVLHTLTGHSAKIVDAVWSPDGSHIATASMDHTVRIWSADNGTQLHVLSNHTGGVTCIDWSPDGARLATGSEDKSVNIWSATNGTLLMKMQGHTDIINEVRWDPTSTFVASASWDKTTFIWNCITGDTVVRLGGHAAQVTTARWSPDGTLLATGSADKTAILWKVTTGTVVRQFPSPSAVFSIHWRPDGAQISIANDDSSRIWDVSGSSSSPVFTLSGHSAGSGKGSCWSPDGQFILTAGWYYLYTSFVDPTARIWDAVTGQERYVLKGHTGFLTSAYWSPDGAQVATSSDDQTAKIWLLDTSPLQEDQSDAVFSIVKPQAAVQSIDMKQCLVGNSKDSLISACSANTGAYPCRIDSMYFTGADAGAFALVSGLPRYTLAVGASQSIEFRFIPVRTGIHTATLHCITQSDTLQAVITGEGIPPAVSIMSAAIDFGQVPLGSQKDTLKAVTIRNNRSVPLVITATRHSGPNAVDFTTLSGGGSFVLGPNDTARLDLAYLPATEGRTSGQLLFEYNDLGSPARVQLFGEGVPLRTTILAEDITARAGDTVSLRLTLGKTSGMQLPGAPTQWKARVHYNPSMLYCLQPGIVCSGTSDSCTLELSGSYNSGTDVLIALPCIATLGMTDHSALVIDEFEWTNSALQTQVITYNGAIRLVPICDVGGVRLFIPAKNALSLATRPNPVQDRLEIHYGLREPLTVTLELLTMTGQIAETIMSKQPHAAGEYSLTRELTALENGVYLLRMVTNKELLTTRVDVVK